MLLAAFPTEQEDKPSRQRPGANTAKHSRSLSERPILLLPPHPATIFCRDAVKRSLQGWPLQLRRWHHTMADPQATSVTLDCSMEESQLYKLMEATHRTNQAATSPMTRPCLPALGRRKCAALPGLPLRSQGALAQVGAPLWRKPGPWMD